LNRSFGKIGPMSDRTKTSQREGATLKELARHLALTKGTVSAVLNNSPYAKAIPQRTKDRIFAGARELNYQPNYFARTLRKKRTYTVGVIVADVGDAYASAVIAGIETGLRQRSYFFTMAVHHHDPEVLDDYTEMLQLRGAEGLITVDTTLTEAPQLPTVAIAGHKQLERVTNIVLDHGKAAELVLQYLYDQGHRDIAIIRGQASSADSQDRWKAIAVAAEERGVAIAELLTTQLERDDPSPEEGYKAAKTLLERKQGFSALFAYNDVSAIGAIRAIKEAGLRVPEDISVVGFDDIREATYHLPSLTTVRQPLLRMGQLAAETLTEHLDMEKDQPAVITVEPELVVRESSGAAKT
jgi:DNA-binding LacI/PurR family transcriptional regulator